MNQKTNESSSRRRIVAVPLTFSAEKQLLLSLVRFGQVPKPGIRILDMPESDVREYLSKHKVALRKRSGPNNGSG